MKFWLGTDRITWLGLTDVPLFLSRRALMRQQTWPKAIGEWALDSGSFSELSQYQRWTISPEEYIDQITVFWEDIGPFQWAAPQDWMCEPWMVEATGLTIPEHQQLTTENFLELRDQAPNLPIIPVLQGWTLPDYLRHFHQYQEAGIDLTKEPLVGVGSVCRRQNMDEAGIIFRILNQMGIQIHGFGVKVTGLRKYGNHLASSDSMAWSFAARKRKLKLEGCTHNQCNHCLVWALQWREHELKVNDYVG